MNTPVHPRIPGWRRPLPRRAGEAQFGTGPEGIIVAGVSENEARALTCLDGTRSLTASYLVAGRAGIPVRRWRELLDLMQRLGVLEQLAHDAPSEPHAPDVPADVPIVVVGAPGTTTAVDGLTAALRRGGVDAGPCDPWRLDSAESAPLLAVVVDLAAIDPRRGDPWAAAGVPHLPVLLEGARSTVGPLVPPGEPAPCLWCVDLHQADRDTAWPSITTALRNERGAIIAPPEHRAFDEPALLDLVAGCVTLFARPLLAGTRPPTGVSVELSAPWPRMDHRRWQVHPQCGRHQIARHTAAGPDRSPDRAAASGQLSLPVA